MNKKTTLTRAFGQPVADDLHTRSAGQSGPLLMEDVHFLEKLSHFDRERIPERVVHAKGSGAHGFFEVTHDLSQYSCANFLNKVGKKTDVLVRFSTVGGEQGSADSERDPRGFAVRFYTEEGNYDLVGNNTPVFFIRDPLKFPDFIHTQKRNPATGLKDANMFWDFLSLTPESLHQVMILFSDYGTPASFRHMHGFGSHTYKWYNARGEYFWVKYHFVSELGSVNFTGPEAEKMRGEDPDHARRDLHNAIAGGEYPVWTLKVQIMSPEQAEAYRFDINDITKVWYHKDFPLIPVGRMVLNKNPENFFAEIEQAAFNPSNFVPGIAASADKMLQGRLFSYHDTHLHRLGANYHLIPVNQPKNAKENNYQRDGYMRTDGGGGSGPNYWPNTFNGPGPDAAVTEPGVPLHGQSGHFEYPKTQDDFEQPGELYRRVMGEQDRTHLISNLVGNMGAALPRLQYRQCALFYKMDADCGERLAAGLKLDMTRVQELAAMTQEKRVAATAK